MGTDAPCGEAAASGVGRLRPATRADVAALSDSLADAFYDDPIWGWLMPEARSRRARLRRFYEVELRHVALRRGRAWTTEDLRGAAISTPPGAWRVPPRAMVLQAFCGLRLGRAARLLPVVESRHPRVPHYYFPHIGVAPPAQGNGIGNALISRTLERCDREGRHAYLEASSERSAALYERLGFRIVEELRAGGSPPLRLMLREPGEVGDAR